MHTFVFLDSFKICKKVSQSNFFHDFDPSQLIVSLQANKEEDDKMRTTAANVAARAAVGGDDMLSKWQLMAEQARQKREGGGDVASGSQPSKDVTRRNLSTPTRTSKEHQEAENRSQSSAKVTPGMYDDDPLLDLVPRFI